MNNRVEICDREIILEGPSIWATVLNGFVAINSHPILVIFWLVASSAIVLFNRLALPLAIKAPLYVGSGLLALLLTSGVMGSLELIIRQEGWMIAAVWECAKLYFPRFFLLGLTITIVVLVIYIPAVFTFEYFGLEYFHDKDIGHKLFAAATIVGLLLFAFYMTFAQSSIIIENLLPLEAIERSFRIVMANRMKVLYLWIIYVGPIIAVELICNRMLDLEWKGKFLQNVILSYIFLLMIMNILYFNYAVKMHGEYEAEYYKE